MAAAALMLRRGGRERIGRRSRAPRPRRRREQRRLGGRRRRRGRGRVGGAVRRGDRRLRGVEPRRRRHVRSARARERRAGRRARLRGAGAPGRARARRRGRLGLAPGRGFRGSHGEGPPRRAELRARDDRARRRADGRPRLGVPGRGPRTRRPTWPGWTGATPRRSARAHRRPGTPVTAMRQDLFHAVLRPDGTRAEARVAEDVCFCCKTGVATAPDGTVYVAWRHIYPPNLRDIAVARSTDGGRTFAPPVRVSEDGWAIDGCPDDGPSIAVDAGGVLHVAWPTLVPGSDRGKGIFYSDSTRRRAHVRAARAPGRRGRRGGAPAAGRRWRPCRRRLGPAGPEVPPHPRRGRSPVPRRPRAGHPFRARPRS